MAPRRARSGSVICANDLRHGLVLAALLLAGCHSEGAPGGIDRQAGESSSVRLAKWKDDHRAAVSVTYDCGDWLSPGQRAVQDAILEDGVHVDFELVTDELPDAKRERMRWLEEHGFGFFGHGARHVNHDRLSPEDAYRSAQSCYDTMRSLGLRPVAFAYPTGHASRRSTRTSVEEAGFLSARTFHASSRRDPYIVPAGVREPSDWYALPTLVMMGRESDPQDHAINDTEELRPYLDGAVARSAWVIITYHDVNKPGTYGFYPLETFRSDLHAIASRDVWAGSVNDVTLYVRERARARIRHAWGREGGVATLRVAVDDGLPDDRYDQPLTLLVRAPRSWRGGQVLVRAEDGRDVTRTDVPHDRRALHLDVPPDGRRYWVRPVQ